MTLRRFLKLLHELGALGVMGAFASLIILHVSAPADSLAGYAAVRNAMALLAKWLLTPSLLLVLASGLLAIVATRSYMDAGWVWIKALLGISMFEGTLVTVAASSRRAAELSALATHGQPNPLEMAQIIHTEWGGLWVLLGVSVANIVLAVWRPRIIRRAAE